MSDLRMPPAGDDRPPLGTLELEHGAPGMAVVRMLGEHDLSTAPEIALILEQATSDSSAVVDFSQCTFIDSSVIAALIKAAQVVRARGEQFAAVIPPEARNVARIAHMIRLSELITVYGSLDDALANVRDACRATSGGLE